MTYVDQGSHLVKMLRRSSKVFSGACGFSGGRGLSSVLRNMRLNPNVLSSIDRKSKIVATIGPNSLPRVSELLLAGMNVARINGSHGDAGFWSEVAAAVRGAVEEARKGPVDFSDGAREDSCAIALDTAGPEIRTGKWDPALLKDGAAVRALAEQMGGDVSELKIGSSLEWPVVRGAAVVLGTDPALFSRGNPVEGGVFVDYPLLAEKVGPGSKVFVDDGLLELVVEEVCGDGTVRCRAANTAMLGERKGVHLPGVVTELPAVTEKDLVSLQWARDNEADFVFASFVRAAAHVQAIRDIVGPRVKVISKIETSEAVDNFDEILRASDGIMVARGDLAVDVALEKMFIIQKQLIAKCNAAGKPVITATQMLESMTSNPKPTRAEISDVSNAVLDGTDAVMLSGETAKGKYPVEALETMAQIALVAEAVDDTHTTFTEVLEANRVDPLSGKRRHISTAESLAAAAVHASYEQPDVRFIVAITSSGATAALTAKYRPSVPILACTSSNAAANALQLSRGVHCLHMPPNTPIPDILDIAQDAALAMEVCKPGDQFLALLGREQQSQPGDVSALHVITVKDPSKKK